MARVSLGRHIFRLDIHIFRPNIDILRPDINTLRLNMDKSAEGWQKLANAKKPSILMSGELVSDKARQ